MKGLARILLLLVVPFTMAPQTLAHPGWRGNGIASQMWWKHAVFVRMPANSTFTTAANTLDAMSEVGADSILLPELQPAGEPPSATQPFSAKFGTEDDLEALLHEAAARRMHVLLMADISRLAAHSDEVRYWMNRGIAGFDVGTLTAADMGSLSVLRTSLGRFPGQRLLLAGFSGWFPEKTLRPRSSAGVTCLSRGSTDVIGQPETGIVTFAAYYEQQAPGVPVFDVSVLDSAELRGVVQAYLARRHTEPYRAKTGQLAKPKESAVHPPDTVRRHRRRLRPTGR